MLSLPNKSQLWLTLSFGLLNSSLIEKGKQGNTSACKRVLIEFDQQYETLVDYFAVIGIDHFQLISLIDELSKGSHTKGNDAALQRNSYMDAAAFRGNFKVSQGRYRILEPTVLASFPK